MKYLFRLIVLICIIHGLVIHGSPLFKAQSINLTKRCTFGGAKGDCGIGDKYQSVFDCSNALACFSDVCSQQTNQKCNSVFDCKGGLACLEGLCTKTSKG
ncbi:7276_t:CDS:2 [Gigaspora margarita]|uniref:7276_t:CDS:1 n=1 Tax=Gigaspora margarita TaxID=4874 RepID=A0ABM8W440_GIGMA|nr:7276_t:CDS:2 [Gigaspora margarita]